MQQVQLFYDQNLNVIDVMIIIVKIAFYFFICMFLCTYATTCVVNVVEMIKIVANDNNNNNKSQ